MYLTYAQDTATSRSSTSFKCWFSRVPAGNINTNGGIENVGTNGNYWSASATTSSGNAYNLNFNSSGVNPQNSNSKQNGFSVRCVAR